MISVTHDLEDGIVPIRTHQERLHPADSNVAPIRDLDAARANERWMAVRSGASDFSTLDSTILRSRRFPPSTLVDPA